MITGKYPGGITDGVTNPLIFEDEEIVEVPLAVNLSGVIHICSFGQSGLRK